MDFSRSLRLRMDEYHITSDELVAEYKKITGNDLTSRSIRRYASGESKPKQEIIDGIEKALSSLAKASFFESSVSAKNTVPEPSTVFSSFNALLNEYGFDFFSIADEKLRQELQATTLDYAYNFMLETALDFFMVKNSSDGFYKYFDDNISVFLTLDTFEIKMCKDFMKLSSPDRDEIIELLRREPVSIQKQIKDSSFFSKSIHIQEMIEKAKNDKPSDYDIYHYRSNQKSESLFDIFRNHEFDSDNIINLLKVSYFSADIASFTSEEWYFLYLLQNLRLNDRGINEIESSYYFFTQSDYIGDKMAALIFYIRKKLVA